MRHAETKQHVGSREIERRRGMGLSSPSHSSKQCASMRCLLELRRTSARATGPCPSGEKQPYLPAPRRGAKPSGTRRPLARSQGRRPRARVQVIPAHVDVKRHLRRPRRRRCFRLRSAVRGGIGEEERGGAEQPDAAVAALRFVHPGQRGPAQQRDPQLHQRPGAALPGM